MVNLTTCGLCGAIHDQNEAYTHQGFHNSMPSSFPCEICGAAVATFKHSEHREFHERQDRIEALLNRLLGDVEAHLHYLSINDKDLA